MTTDFAYINYDLIPEHMRASLRNYIERGWPIGGFLFEVLTNDLVHAYGHADDTNRTAMPQWAEWLYWECPAPAWGSAEKVREWQRQRREQMASADDAASVAKEEAQ